MKRIFLIIALISASIFAQRPPDEIATNFTNATSVNAALLKAAAAISGSGTANQIAYFTGASTIGSLSTITYPSLTELTYLKGATSSLQTQINGKQSALVSGTHIKTINNQSLLGSGNITVAPDTAGLWLKIYKIVKTQLTGDAIKGTVATLDSMIDDFRKNNYLRLNK